MQIINLSTDKNILNTGSSSYNRMINYGSVFDGFHVLVLSEEKTEFSVSKKIFFYGSGGNNKLSRIFFAYLRILRISKSIKSDVVISSQDPFELGLLALITGKVFQVQLHTDIGSPFWRKNILNKIRLIVARFVLPRAKNIRVVSERIKKVLLADFDIPEEKIQVLPIRFDIPEISSVQPKKFLELKPAIITVARLEEEKNVIDSIRVLKEIIKKYPDAGLILVGDGSLRNKLEDYVKNHGLLDNVLFMGSMPSALPFIKGADIAVVPSLYEGYSLFLAEASALGIPIVTTDVGIVGEILKHNESALVCPVGDVSCLASSVEKIIEDSTLKSKLATNARRAIVEAVIDEKTFLEKYKNGLMSCL